MLIFLGFYAFAFIAGLNVDKFVSKLLKTSHTQLGALRNRAPTKTLTQPLPLLRPLPPLVKLLLPEATPAAPVIPVAAPAIVAPAVQDQTQVT